MECSTEGQAWAWAYRLRQILLYTVTSLMKLYLLLSFCVYFCNWSQELCVGSNNNWRGTWNNVLSDSWCHILLLFHKQIKGNLEEEFSRLSEVIWKTNHNQFLAIFPKHKGKNLPNFFKVQSISVLTICKLHVTHLLFYSFRKLVEYIM